MTKTDFINMEYEARVMINEEQYFKLMKLYQKKNKPKSYLVNINTYFDYDELTLTNNHIVLRTRSINDSSYELTLKIKGDKGDIEYNHSLTSKEYKEINRIAFIPQSEVKEELLKQGIDLSRLKKIVELKTERLEIQYKHHLFVIDKNYFRNRVDYNVEVESTSKSLAKMYINQHIKPLGITHKKGYISKSRRAIFDL